MLYLLIQNVIATSHKYCIYYMSDVKYYDYRRCLQISFFRYHFTSLFAKSRL